jgi:hypothetical protein
MGKDRAIEEMDPAGMVTVGVSDENHVYILSGHSCQIQTFLQVNRTTCSIDQDHALRGMDHANVRSTLRVDKCGYSISDFVFLNAHVYIPYELYMKIFSRN